jgi:hypothetical protein
MDIIDYLFHISSKVLPNITWRKGEDDLSGAARDFFFFCLSVTSSTINTCILPIINLKVTQTYILEIISATSMVSMVCVNLFVKILTLKVMDAIGKLGFDKVMRAQPS